MSRARFAWLMLIATCLVVATDAGAAGWLPRPGFEVSGHYGTVSRTSEDPSFDLLDATYGGGWSAGATAEWAPAPTWTVVSGLRYIDAGQSQRFTFTITGGGSPFAASADLRDTWRWLAVPVRARVTPWAFPLSFEAGPEVQVLLSAKSHQHLEEGPQVLLAAGDLSRTIRLAPAAQIFEEVGTFGGDRDVTDLYRRVNLVLGGGVSYAWPTRMGRVAAHARCGFGLNDLRKSDVIVSRTRTVEVGLGWQW